MKRLLLFTIALMLLLTDTTAQTQPQWPEVKREMKPGSRWWWMGSAVDEANLKSNIAEYARTGIGTLEITPIYGVKGNEAKELNYLSQEWMEALKTCQTTGDEAGVDIDMNGGTGWPFGGPWVSINDAAGKLVTKNETKTADGTQTLTMNVTSPEGDAPLSKVMAYQQDGDQTMDVTSFVSGATLSWQAPAGEWLLLAIYNGHTGQQVKRAAPGGEGNVLDHYNAEAVKRYLKHFDQRFEATNSRWPHTFFNDSYEVYGADWTPVMFSEFEKYRGYKLEEHMDQLLGLGKRKDTGNQVLADYRQTLSDMLLNNFTRQWTEWAHSHGATTRNQGHGSPGNLIDFYAAVDIPEIEGFGITDFKIKGLRTDGGFTSKNLSDLATLKYASSAAHVTGKPMTSSETFTWLTEHFRTSLSQMKPELDFMFIAGVNHIFFHGTTYSPQEAAWPGWKFYASIDMSPTNSIWRDAPAMMQYATRCQSFLQMGQPDNDLLVYAPFQNAMHQNTGANAARLQLFDINTLSQKIPSMVSVVNNAEKAGLDCDFISDQLLLTTTCENGLLKTAAGTCYKALVVPVSTNMPDSTKNHLDALAQQGATIVYKYDVATLTSLAKGEELRTTLGLRTIRRKTSSGYHYFIANLSGKDIEGYTTLAVPFADAWLYDPMTGAIRRSHTDGDKVWIALKSGQSIILQTHHEKTAGGTMPTDEPVKEMTGIETNSFWELLFLDKNYKGPLEKPQTWETISGLSSYMGTGIYHTVFNIDKKTLQMANGGFRLDLGDVRESARVYINDVEAGCAWSAPFELDVTGLVKEGDNSLVIEVTNLPANRIRQMDINGIVWRNFKDVNILAVKGGSTSQANVTYKDWSLVPSGLNGAVRLIPLRKQSSELTATIKAFEKEGDNYYPTYQLTTPTGNAIQSVSITTTDGKVFSDFTLSDDRQLLTVKGAAEDFIVVKVMDTEELVSETYLHAYGAFSKQKDIDLTLDTAPACDWQVMSNTTNMAGFNLNTAWRRAPKGNSAKEVTLYDGIKCTSENAIYYFYFPGYGMNTTNDFTLQAEAQKGDIVLLSYLIGKSEKIAYEAADSLVMTGQCENEAEGVALQLPSRNDYYVYRSLQQYRPKGGASAINTTRQGLREADMTYYYNLQGQRIAKPQQGIYVCNGKKIVMK